MVYQNIVAGRFVDRPNRFIAHVEINGVVETVHVKNTGRCRELLLPGVRVILEVAANPDRKTKYDLIAVYKQGFGLINMDSQAPNKVVAEWLAGQGYDVVKPEYKYGSSRIDFYMEKFRMDDGGQEVSERYLMEVKGCTLEIDGIGYFPDAPTERGIKHLKELAGAAGQGYHCIMAYVIQMEGINEVRPNITTHPAYGKAVEEALAAGVKVLFLCTEVKENELRIVSSRYLEE
ncbi:DNA/RNA nuclease SfsA [Anaerovibrio slackiae]|uniref:DNA/RNA nuclease SfsA n=1 Tax=Anaerovibrio slackiae TaxID=2652309 RepID=UPI00386E8DCA